MPNSDGGKNIGNDPTSVDPLTIVHESVGNTSVPAISSLLFILIFSIACFVDLFYKHPINLSYPSYVLWIFLAIVVLYAIQKRVSHLEKQMKAVAKLLEKQEKH